MAIDGNHFDNPAKHTDTAVRSKVSLIPIIMSMMMPKLCNLR